MTPVTATERAIAEQPTVDQPLPETAQASPELMMQMITGAWATQCLYVAAKLKLADYVQAGAQSVDALAAQVGADSRSLFRLLRALASLGVFTETEPQHFAMTPLAEYLRSDVPGSLRAVAVMMGEEHYQAWGGLLGSVETGAGAFEQMYGVNAFEYYEMNPEPAEIFDQAMTGFSSLESAAIAKAYDFSSFNTLVDVAGGQGGLLATLLQANSHLEGLLFDLPAVIQGAHSMLVAAQVADRCMLAHGSFFDSVPTGGDAYLLKHIIHDWDDERSIVILKNCRAAMPKTGKLLLAEMVIPEGNGPALGKMMDINMLVMCPGGRERTEQEYRQLLAKAGFELCRIVPTESPVSVIEAVPV